VREQLVVPVAERQELLERPGRHVRQAGHGLDALAGQVAELALHVVLEVQAGVAALEAVGELVEVVRQRGAE
jgi:hypothetical protein